MSKVQPCSMTWRIILVFFCTIAIANAWYNNSYDRRLERAKSILERIPVVDGHNDLAYFIRNAVQNQVEKFPFDKDLTLLKPYASMKNSHTDLPRLRKGKVGGQFWSAFVPCELQCKNVVNETLEQIDVIKRLIKKYPNDLQLVIESSDILKAQQKGKIASMIGVEGGHSMDSSLANLRKFYKEGARYMTLTHACNTPWADSSVNEYSPEFGGLSKWGESVIKEMNRLGMLIDLSHVSAQTMRKVLDLTKAPVIFSHSGIRHFHNDTRNIPDDILKRLRKNGGLVMVSASPSTLTPEYIKATMTDLVAQINYVRDVVGYQHVGLGCDFNSVNRTTIGMEDVSKYPDLFAELMADESWRNEDLMNLAAFNIIRVFRQTEEVAKSMAKEAPIDTPIPKKDLEKYQKACAKNES